MFAFSLLFYCLFCLIACGTEGDGTDYTPGERYKTTIDQATQSFEIIPTQDTIIYGEQGTVVKIKGGGLVFPGNIEIKSPVKIELTEYYKMSDMLLKGLATTSRHDLLETAGMMFLSATVAGDNREVLLNGDSAIMLTISEAQHKLNFSIFLGEDTEEGIDWVAQRPKTNPEGAVWVPYPSTFGGDFPLNQLGWVNYDKFFMLAGERMLVVLNKSGYQEEDYTIVLKKFNTIVGCLDQVDKVEFPGMPVGQEAVLIGKGFKNGTLFYAMEDIVIGDNIGPLKFSETTLEQYRNAIETRFESQQI